MIDQGKPKSRRVFLTISPLYMSLLMAGCGGSDGNNYDIVYLNDGGIQCESVGRSENETAQILIDNGIDVVVSECGYLTGIAIAAQCGLGDTNINLHTIHVQDTPEAQNLGFESVSSLVREEDKGYEITECRK